MARSRHGWRCKPGIGVLLALLLNLSLHDIVGGVEISIARIGTHSVAEMSLHHGLLDLGHIGAIEPAQAHLLGHAQGVCALLKPGEPVGGAIGLLLVFLGGVFSLLRQSVELALKLIDLLLQLFIFVGELLHLLIGVAPCELLLNGLLHIRHKSLLWGCGAWLKW